MARPFPSTHRRSLMEDAGIQVMTDQSGRNSLNSDRHSFVCSDFDVNDQFEKSPQQPEKRRALWSRKNLCIHAPNWARSCCGLHRKNLMSRSRLLVDLSLLAAGAGVVLMLVEGELYVQGFVSKTSVTSLYLKIAMTVTTVLLLAMVMTYNITSVQITMVENRLDHWRLAVTVSFVCRLLLELLVCAIHPLPLSLLVSSSHSQAKAESALSVLMFLRLYLLARFLVVHSRYLNDTATRSLGGFSKVHISTQFVFKALMSEWPSILLIVSMVAIVFLSGWSVRTCEAYLVLEGHLALNDTPAANIPEAFWSSAITFLTVGYGDVVPKSECGRVMAVATGLLGVGLTALVVAVVANKLQLSRAEKYVYTSSVRMELVKRQKNAAADVITNVIRLWRIQRRSDQRTHSERTQVKSKLLRAIRATRDARKAKTENDNSAIGLLDVYTSSTDMARRIESMETRLASVSSTLQTMVTEIQNLAATTQHHPS